MLFYCIALFALSACVEGINESLHVDSDEVHTTDFSAIRFNGFNSQTNEIILQWKDIPLQSKQIGTTFNFTYALNKSSKLTAFGTIQKTMLIDYEQSTDPTNLLAPSDTITTKHKNTPTYYGGAYLESKILNKIILFANFYAYSSQEYWYIVDTGKIKGKLRLDAKIAYPIWRENTIFINGRNILNNDSVEFGFADSIGSLYLIGVDIKL
jgi:iron complex outermembrane receptor protein